LLRPWNNPPPEARPLRGAETAAGFDWEDALGHWCLLTDVVSGDARADRAEQARVVLDKLDGLLHQVGLGFGDVLRTWFFLDDILAWYDKFNQVRTRFLADRGLLDRPPASTAVGCPNALDSALVAHLVALKVRSDKVRVERVNSPLQGSAFDYGSAFSRATMVDWPRGRRLYVSGTSSIDERGCTLHHGNARRQAEETFGVISALLAVQGFSFDDVTRAVGYLPDPRDAGVLQDLWSRHIISDMLWLPAEICRRELRFELELIAHRDLC
jgi:enamine deaminase RidA (YjgF/YER057c/UK114 family)